MIKEVFEVKDFSFVLFSIQHIKLIRYTFIGRLNKYPLFEIFLNVKSISVPLTYFTLKFVLVCMYGVVIIPFN